ncbi:diguanylate cyclase domain-containing protein [Roseateles chitinivorans]|uniref:sensor domain-containing diguanylate cyclase n=1 Tax=Roseateles chitinivorans TaxID=2917965 RepID=UPI003D677395
MIHQQAFGAPSLGRVRRWLVVGNLVLAAILCTAAWLSLHNAREGDEDAARLTAENLATSMSGEVAAELSVIDNALATVAERYGKTRQSADRASVLGEMVDEQQTLLKHVSAVRVTDASGDVVIPQALAGRVFHFGDRSYFERARSRDATVVSEPLRSRVTGAWIIVVARRLINADGGFDGIVLTELTSEHFSQLFAGMELGRSGAISMRTSDSFVLVSRHSASEPQSAKGVGLAIVSQALRDSIARDPARGWYVTPTALDQVERVTAYRRVPGYPFTVYAGLSTSEYLAAWYRQALELWLLVAVMIALVGAISALLYRGQQREYLGRMAADRLTREQELMLENDLVGMVRLRERVIQWDNRAMANLLGYASAELRGMSMRELYLDEATFDQIGRAGYGALRAGERFRTQVQMRRKDGSPLWVDLSGMLVSEDESLWMLVDVDALKRSEETAQSLALRDALTGLPNRRLFEEKLADAQQQALRSQRGVAVCYLDLDGFKPVNDTHGHDAGDVVLKEVALRLQQSLRGNDVVARLGGDEFAILLSASDDAGSTRTVLQRCLAEIERPIRVNEHHTEHPTEPQTVRVSASIGVVLAQGTCDIGAVMRGADAAMYAAKRAGKARIHFGPTMSGLAAAALLPRVSTRVDTARHVA